MTGLLIFCIAAALILAYLLGKNKHKEDLITDGIVDEASFIIQCRTNWFLGIRPSDDFSKGTKEYKSLIEIAKAYFANNQYEKFAGHFMEGQYLIPLWTAHLILEYGEPSEKLKKKCLKVIEEYTDNPLAPDVAIQEKKWLENYTSL